MDSKNRQTTPATTSTTPNTPTTGRRQRANGTSCHIQHSPSTPTTGLRERGNDTSRSTGRSGQQKAATRRNCPGQDGMSHRGAGGTVEWVAKKGAGGSSTPRPFPQGRGMIFWGGGGTGARVLVSPRGCTWVGMWVGGTGGSATGAGLPPRVPCVGRFPVGECHSAAAEGRRTTSPPTDFPDGSRSSSADTLIGPSKGAGHEGDGRQTVGSLCRSRGSPRCHCLTDPILRWWQLQGLAASGSVGRRGVRRGGARYGARAPHALEGKGPQSRPKKRSDRRLEEGAEAVGGGDCRLQINAMKAGTRRQGGSGWALKGGVPPPMRPQRRPQRNAGFPGAPPRPQPHPQCPIGCPSRLLRPGTTSASPRVAAGPTTPGRCPYDPFCRSCVATLFVRETPGALNNSPSACGATVGWLPTPSPPVRRRAHDPAIGVPPRRIHYRGHGPWRWWCLIPRGCSVLGRYAWDARQGDEGDDAVARAAGGMGGRGPWPDPDCKRTPVPHPPLRTH